MCEVEHTQETVVSKLTCVVKKNWLSSLSLITKKQPSLYMQGERADMTVMHPAK